MKNKTKNSNEKSALMKNIFKKENLKEKFIV